MWQTYQYNINMILQGDAERRLIGPTANMDLLSIFSLLKSNN